MIHHIPYLFLVHEKIAPKVRQRKYRKRKYANPLYKNPPFSLLISKTFITFALDSTSPLWWVGQDIMDSILYRSYMT